MPNGSHDSERASSAGRSVDEWRDLGPTCDVSEQVARHQVPARHLAVGQRNVSVTAGVGDFLRVSPCRSCRPGRSVSAIVQFLTPPGTRPFERRPARIGMPGICRNRTSCSWHRAHPVSTGQECGAAVAPTPNGSGVGLGFGDDKWPFAGRAGWNFVDERHSDRGCGSVGVGEPSHQ